MTAADEQHLIQMAKGGSHEAFRCLVERHMKQAYNVAYGFVNDHYHAEEVAQESILRAYRSLKSFRGDSEFGTWLYRIVVNLSLNTVKRNKRIANWEAPVEAERGATENGSVPGERQLLAAHIYRALQELPTLQRSVTDHSLRREAVYYLGAIGSEKARKALQGILRGK